MSYDVQDYNAEEFVKTLPLQEEPKSVLTTTDSPIFLEPRTKKGHKYIHVSKPSYEQLSKFGPYANQLVNAKGTLCKKCALKNK